MKLYGWCEVCHKFRIVRVTGADVTRRRVIGICGQCEEEKDA